MLITLSNASIAQWVRQTSGTEAILNAVAFANLNTGIAVGESGVMLKTTNKGVTWVPLASPTPAYLSSACFVNENTGWIAGEGGSIYKTINRGENWVSQTFPEPYYISDIYFLNENTGTAVGNFGFIIKTTNGGNSWFQQNREPGQHLNGVFFINENTGWCAGGNGKNVGTILKTTDGGDNWFNQASGTSEALYKVYFSDENTGTMVGSAGEIIRTTNGGNTWTHQVSNTSTYLLNLYFSDNSNGIIVGFGGIVLRTTNGGSDWIQQPSATSFGLIGLSFPDKYLNLGWAVGDGGIIVRYTGVIPNVPYNFSVKPVSAVGSARLSWQDSSINESGYIIQRRDIVNTNWIIVDTVESNETQYIESGLQTDREYAWRMYSYNVIGRSAYTDTVFLVLSGIEPVSNVIPQKHELRQNYPNPFNPVTTFSFDIPNAGNVNFVIYDMLGKEIAQLINGNLQAGSYEINWNASALSSGIYFYKLQAGNFTAIKKLVLSK